MIYVQLFITLFLIFFTEQNYCIFIKNTESIELQDVSGKKRSDSRSSSQDSNSSDRAKIATSQSTKPAKQPNNFYSNFRQSQDFTPLENASISPLKKDSKPQEIDLQDWNFNSKNILEPQKKSSLFEDDPISKTFYTSEGELSSIAYNNEKYNKNEIIIDFTDLDNVVVKSGKKRLILNFKKINLNIQHT